MAEEEVRRVDDVLFELFSSFGSSQHGFVSPHGTPDETFDSADSHQFNGFEKRGFA